MTSESREDDELRRGVQQRLAAERAKPFVVSIMGQTGVGKSSLLNAIFGTNLATSAVAPMTKEKETITVLGAGGGELSFNDMPGIGEADGVDQQYLDDYRQQLLQSDVVLWAIHADNRSVSFDKSALTSLMSADEADRSALISKITFVLTKVDLLTPTPWLYSMGAPDGYMVPSPEIKELLAEKERYFGDAFITPFGEFMTSQTYNDTGLRASGPEVVADRDLVVYRGLLTAEKVAELTAAQPRHRGIYERLYANYRVIPCSSHFRYNLTELMVVIVNKLGAAAIGRFENFTTDQELNRLPLAKAKSFHNVVFVNPQTHQIAFDLTRHTIAGEK